MSGRVWILVFALAIVACSSEPDDDTAEGDDTIGDDDSTATGDDDSAAGAQAPTDVAAVVDTTIGSLVFVSWSQPVEGSATVEYLVGEDWLTTPARSLAAGVHEQLLLGIPYDEHVTVRVVVDDLSSDEAAVTTDPRPANIPLFEVLASDPEAWDAQLPWILFSINERDTDYGGPWWTVIIDRQGRLVWALRTQVERSTLYARASLDGRSLLIDHNSFWTIFDAAEASEIHRFGIDGQLHEVMATPGMGHAYTELPDGSLVYPINGTGNDGLMLLSTDGDVETLWSCTEFMTGLGVEPHCGVNSVSWSPDNDRFLLSLFGKETVVEVDRPTGQTIRWFGHLVGSWSFDPAYSLFWWQHGANFTDAGTLLLSTRIAEHVAETVVREYELDEGATTLRQVWSFGDGEGLFADILGEAQRLPNGNTMHNLGDAARMREITPDGRVVWDLEIEGSSQYLARSTPLESLYTFLDEWEP